LFEFGDNWEIGTRVMSLIGTTCCKFKTFYTSVWSRSTK